MPGSPTQQQGRRRKPSDSDKPESEHVEEAGVAGEETEQVSGEPELVEPWDLYRRGQKPSSKLLEDARATLRGTMLAQLRNDKAIKENKALQVAMLQRIDPTPPAPVHTKPAPVHTKPAPVHTKPAQAQPYPYNQPALGPYVYFGFGETCPYPRWVVVPVPQQGNQQLPKAPGSRNVMWKFEPGPPSGWRGLTEEQLYEWSYNWHRFYIEDPAAREYMVSYLQRGPLKEFVKGIAQPLPPLPDPPATNFYLAPFTPPPPGPFDPNRWTYNGYARPDRPLRQGMLSRGLNPGQQGVGDEENQLPGIGTYGNEYGANRPAEEAGPAKPLAFDDGQEPAVDADPNRQALETGRNVDGSPNDLPTAPRPKPAVQDPGKRGTLAAKKGIREVARIKIGPRPGQAGVHRIEYTKPKRAPGGPPETESEPESESESEIPKSKEQELVTEALEQLKKNHEKHFPQRALRRIRTWPGDEIPTYTSGDDLKLVPDYSLEHRSFHDPNPEKQVQTAKRAASRLPKQAAGADADSDDNDGFASAGPAGNVKRARTKKSTTAGTTQAAGTAKTAGANPDSDNNDGSARAGPAGRAKRARTTKKSTTAGTAAPAQQSRYPKRGDRK